ncbi:hypothetical protein GUJ93_ZPchr0010g10967 [Zizania palustris]|uniref:Uncharacterized protein n=1 Tax=Zizania palustris TaxID=103762 RepID=A0A8J5W6B3_ZIZPA|nr:hypothetical protein GUJ93_ZPchr0010g10967 [Zizania palustris]
MPTPHCIGAASDQRPNPKPLRSTEQQQQRWKRSRGSWTSESRNGCAYCLLGCSSRGAAAERAQCGEGLGGGGGGLPPTLHLSHPSTPPLTSGSMPWWDHPVCNYRQLLDTTTIDPTYIILVIRKLIPQGSAMDKESGFN